MADEDTAQAVKEKTEQSQDQQNDTTREDSKTQVQSVEFPEASGTGSTGVGTSIDILLDMNIPVTVAIGKVVIPIQRILQLSPGSVLKLDKPIDAPADLYLKNIKFATGSIVVVEDRFAVRIKNILGTGASTEPNSE